MYNIITLLKRYLKFNNKSSIITNILFFIIGLIGFLMFISGILQLIPMYLTPWQSIIFGIFTLWISIFLIIYSIQTSNFEFEDDILNLYHDLYEKENIINNNTDNNTDNQIILCTKNNKLIEKNINKNMFKKSKLQKIKISS